jgi:hypothetical protein
MFRANIFLTLLMMITSVLFTSPRSVKAENPENSIERTKVTQVAFCKTSEAIPYGFKLLKKNAIFSYDRRYTANVYFKQVKNTSFYYYQVFDKKNLVSTLEFKQVKKNLNYSITVSGCSINPSDQSYPLMNLKKNIQDARIFKTYKVQGLIKNTFLFNSRKAFDPLNQISFFNQLDGPDAGQPF